MKTLVLIRGPWHAQTFFRVEDLNHLHPEEGKSIWPKHRQCNKRIHKLVSGNHPFLMTEPPEKPSLYAGV